MRVRVLLEMLLSQSSCEPLHLGVGVLIFRSGAYATDGLAATMAVNSDFADNTDIDLYIFAGPVNFIGYFPQVRQSKSHFCGPLQHENPTKHASNSSGATSPSATTSTSPGTR